MPRYFLDTNICVYALHRRMPSVVERITQAHQGELLISTLVSAELAGGVMNSQRVDASRRALEMFLAQMVVLPWGEGAIWHYAHHAVRLKKAGRSIGTIDLLLGCQALAEDAILVTNNTREFERIEGLKLENWAHA